MDSSDDRLDARALSLPGVDSRAIASCDSTNAMLLAERPAHPVLLAADEQTAGRGRRGRRWLSPAGTGAMFSLARRMRAFCMEPCSSASLSGMSTSSAP